jgi:hypothetical protein
MVSATVGASIWILPYVNQFKSGRSFAMEIKRIVPATTSLYIYEDTMNHFNFYTEREVIPVLSSPNEVESVLRETGNSYLLIKERDLKSLSLSGQHVVARDSIGSTTWNLVSLNSQRR